MPKDILDPKKQILREERRKNERWFESRWKLIGGQPYEAQYRYHPTRKWRADYTFPSVKILLECDGGGHKMYWKVYRNDVEKMNAALFLGWQVFRVTTDMVRADDVYFLQKLQAYIEEQKSL
jgi:very-short-patch-repair endonuclease